MLVSGHIKKSHVVGAGQGGRGATSTPICALILFGTLRLSLGGRRGDCLHDSSRNRGDPLMPLLFSLGQHMHLWRRCRGGCVPQRRSWRILMTSISRPDKREWAMSWQPALRSCGLTPGSECMVAKPTSGTGQGRDPGCVTFCRDKLKRRILTQGYCEDPKSPPQNRGSKCWGLLWVTRTLSTNIWNRPGRENS